VDLGELEVAMAVALRQEPFLEELGQIVEEVSSRVFQSLKDESSRERWASRCSIPACFPGSGNARMKVPVVVRL